MFSLILVVVAVGLTVVMVLATGYYGADAFSKGGDEAEIAKSLNEVSQIKGALVAYSARTGTHANSLNDLVGAELKGIPDGWGIELPSQTAFEASLVIGGSETRRRNSCIEINRRLGMHADDPPNCADIASDFTGCCMVPDIDAEPAD